MKLNGDEVKQLQRALISAFPSESALEQMVRFTFDENLKVIARGEDLSAVVFKLIAWAESKGKLEDLVGGALEENPTNPELKAFSEKWGCQPLKPHYPQNIPSSNTDKLPEISKPQSLFTLISHQRNKLFVFAAILVFGLVGAYKSFTQSFHQLDEDKARLAWSETKGNIGEYKGGIIPVKSKNLNLHNFSVEAQFDNPYDGAINNWTYGFAFQENTSSTLNNPNRKSFDIWVTSKEKEWHFGSTASSSDGKLTNLDVSNNSSNKLRLIVQGKKAIFFVNDVYVETFDISDFTKKGDIFLIAKDGIDGKSVKYENLKVLSLDN